AGKTVDKVCARCRGEGRERKDREITLTIPPGIDDGQQLRVAGEGEAGMRGGPTGDLYVLIRIKDHESFKRDNDDLVHVLRISPAQAVLGDEVSVPTIEGGEVKVRIPRRRSTARWSASAGRVCRIWGARAAATSSCISTSLCPGRSRRSSAGCTSSCATSRLRRRKTPKIPISSDASKTRWVGTSALHWLELAVPTHAEAVEAASEILSRVGHNGIAVEVPLEPRGGTDHTVKAYITLDADAYAKVSDIRDALGHLQAFGLGPIGELAVHEVRDEDWLESWKASFTPIRVGDFLIRPTWSEAVPDGATEIVLDPGMAFGTGLHPTTRQCLEAICALAIDGR